MMGRRSAIILLWACILVTLVLIQAQDQSGFVSIDCGSSRAYSDVKTSINYVPDEDYIDSGINSKIAVQYKTNGLQTQFENVRSFPDGERNCYTLKPKQVAGTQYLIRAQFMYGNYDSINKSPEFDLHIGVNLWTTVNFTSIDGVVTAELIHVPSTNITNVCLVNKNKGTPFISVLELRLISKEIYGSQTGTLTLVERLNMGTDSLDNIRFADDSYDRIWQPVSWSDSMNHLSTKSLIGNNNVYNPPVNVLRTAITPKNANDSLDFYWSADKELEHYIYLHFAELVNLTANESRQFDIYLNDTTLFYAAMRPSYLSVITVYTTRPYLGNWFNFTFRMSGNSTLPPLLNAIEIYTQNLMPQMETKRTDIDAINKIKLSYNVKKLWQGDPCAPKGYTWDGLTCNFPGFDEPSITGLNLSSSNLFGQISQNISGLKLLESLDLSNNSLTGSIPDFLSTMAFLKVLNLKGNNFTGTVPAQLIKKSQDGTLKLSVDGYPCVSGSCNTTPPDNGNGKKSSMILIIACVAGGVVVAVIVLVVVIICCICRKKETKDGQNSKVTSETLNSHAAVGKTNDHIIETGNQQFTYSQVLTMTNNFERPIGKGGFGTVYHGYLDGAQVAVKMLSPSSSQGYKEFQAEAQLLMRVHHRNLTSLIGYCDEGNKLGLIYEYMANGNLETNLSSKNPQYLTWEDRLFIAVDAAQGLEYLHNGCKPPIVHRDIKSPNILLDDQFHAKIADFGLSRVFRVDGDDDADYVPTMVAGTPGYLDPEYYNSQTLNEKSDVFAFGVVLHEIITSEPVIAKTPDKTHLCKRVSSILTTTGNVKSIVDPRLQGDYEINSVWKAIEIAIACVLPESNQRPAMAHVVNELSHCLKMERERKKDLYATQTTIDTIEMVSMDMNTGLTPVAR